MTMVLLRLGVALSALLVAVTGVAQPAGADETLQARQVYEEVNKQLPALTRVTLVAKRPDVEYKSAVKAWSDRSGVRKIETTDKDDDGNVVTEYYFAGGALVFVYVATQGFDKNNRAVTRNEDREYFRAGRMFRWLAGKEKAPQPPTSQDFIEEAKTRLAAARFFADAAGKAGKPSAP